MEKVTFNGVVYDARHGGPFDRGTADSYYGRLREPHYYHKDTGNSTLFSEHLMLTDEIAAYHAGYDHNEQFGGKKEY
jgi:hypothetical protein